MLGYFDVKIWFGPKLSPLVYQLLGHWHLAKTFKKISFALNSDFLVNALLNGWDSLTNYSFWGAQAQPAFALEKIWTYFIGQMDENKFVALTDERPQRY